ncbi:hypothetical protein K466DRAFT_322475 [Polyporus arcularius HHB13444]|uniref:Uncharacterized protein n=1 Tax=Polyporus arcularius HHB13444 TaxID=1314778 RepID=A0A5C3PSP4_9APHY|nr:hypothetical protein K466DRAFT_322475 [Polyporus arcularius HHB13444]
MSKRPGDPVREQTGHGSRQLQPPQTAFQHRETSARPAGNDVVASPNCLPIACQPISGRELPWLDSSAYVSLLTPNRLEPDYMRVHLTTNTKDDRNNSSRTAYSLKTIDGGRGIDSVCASQRATTLRLDASVMALASRLKGSIGVSTHCIRCSLPYSRRR